ncbi:hypothetical protein MFIFM68171_01657 [Madurella fahalii]|uniref:Uncharacterized protein n=1 Tax=Madurella fahalii TaxID=1157608 RepID=A0ABQ0G122_9PEZI
MGESDKAVVTHTEAARRRGCMGHCAKFWWAYLIALVCITVLVVPLVILVGVPKIAQSKLDAAELIIDGIAVTNTQAQNMTMAINSTIRSDGQVHATIDAFRGSMYLEDRLPHTPFATIDFPQTTSEAHQTVSVSQFLEIEDVEALTIFNTWLLANESLRVTVVGDTHVHVRGISRAYPVTFRKTVTMPGLRMLTGTVVNETTIALEKDERGDNFWGKAYIPNYSVVAFELGNTTFRNYLLGEEIGTVFIDNLSLKPGMDNVYDMRASIEQTPVLNALGQRPYCDETRGVLPFQIRGKSVVNHGQPLSYFADALAAANQTLEIDIGGTLEKSFGLTIPCSDAGGGGEH